MAQYNTGFCEETKKYKKRKEVIIDGQEYESHKEAAAAYGNDSACMYERMHRCGMDAATAASKPIELKSQEQIIYNALKEVFDSDKYMILYNKGIARTLRERTGEDFKGKQERAKLYETEKMEFFDGNFRYDFMVIEKSAEGKLKHVVAAVECDEEKHMNPSQYNTKSRKNCSLRESDFSKDVFAMAGMQVPLLRIKASQLERVDDMILHFYFNPVVYMFRQNTYENQEAYYADIKKKKKEN